MLDDGGDALARPVDRFFGALAVATWLSAANEWPTAIFGYDTATPWLTRGVSK